MNIALLNDKKSIKELVEVDVNKSILESIGVELNKDEYNFIVTSDNVKFAKEKMADLNKSIKFIDTFRKDKVNAESVDIDNFKANFKDYVALFDVKRESIKKDVEVFGREQKDSITKELSLYTDEAIENANLRYEFTNIDTADLIKLGSVNPSGSLKKATTETIDGRVLACKSKQDKYDMRLMDLENQSHRAKLESPLTITHIQGIIYLDDDTEYQTKLNELIESEIKRQDVVKANLEAQQKVINEQNRIKNIFAVNFDNLTIDSIDICISDFQNTIVTDGFGDFTAYAVEYSNSQIAKLENIKTGLKKANEIQKAQNVEVVHETTPKHTPKVEDGKKVVLIDVHLQFKVKDSIPNEMIVAKVNTILKQAGFDESLIGVEVVS